MRRQARSSRPSFFGEWIPAAGPSSRSFPPCLQRSRRTSRGSTSSATRRLRPARWSTSPRSSPGSRARSTGSARAACATASRPDFHLHRRARHAVGLAQHGLLPAKLFAKWAVYDSPASGAAGWLSAEVSIKEGLGGAGANQSAQANLGSLTNTTGIDLAPQRRPHSRARLAAVAGERPVRRRSPASSTRATTSTPTPTRTRDAASS